MHDRMKFRLVVSLCLSVFFISSIFACDYKALILSDLHVSPDLQHSMPYTPEKIGTDLDVKSFKFLMKKIVDNKAFDHTNGIWILGDNIGHMLPIDKIKQAHHIIYNQFDTLSPPTYFVHGNNDSLAGNYQAYTNENGSPYALAISDWQHSNNGFVSRTTPYCLNNDEDTYPCFLNESPQEGHYHIRLQPNLSFIVLNSVVLNGDYQTNDQTQANFALSWFEEQLHQSADMGDNVLIAMHVPPGFNLYSKRLHLRDKITFDPVFQRKFIHILKHAINGENLRVIGIVAAHTHHDELHLIQMGSKMIPVIINPGLSTTHGNAPAFQTLCLNKINRNWHIGELKAYKIESAKADFKLYKDLSFLKCQHNPKLLCFNSLIDFPLQWIELLKRYYFAKNPHQQRVLETNMGELFTRAA